MKTPTNAQRIHEMLSTSARHLGPGDLLFLLARLSVLAAGRATLPLDRLFYPAHAAVEIKRPLFILGHPRSGTTFLHRLLCQTDEFPAFRTWELLVPALSARALVRPLLPVLIRLFSRGFHDDSAVFAEGSHEVGVDTIEEEELLLLFSLDTQFLLLFTALGFAESDPLDLLFPDAQPDHRRAASMRLLRGCLKRQILATGRSQVVAKMPYSTTRVRSLLEAFPDARFVYMVRSPLQTIPSHLSLHRHFFRQLYGLDRLSDDLKARYWDRRYRFNVSLYQSFHEVEKLGVIPEDQLMVVRYPELSEDLLGTVRRLSDFAGLSLSDALWAKISAQSAKQASYQRPHTNRSVEDFGISTDRVLADLGWVFQAYDLAPPAALAGAVP